MHRVLRGFFPWVWASIVVLLATGYGLIFVYYGGFAGLGLHIHLMQGTGTVMMLLFVYLYYVPWRRFCQAIETDAFAEAAAALEPIRSIVTVNLVLGVVTVVAGASGRFW